MPKSPWARVLLAIFVLLILLFLVLFITAPKPKEFRVVIAGQEFTDKEQAKERFIQEIEKDSDNDGLKDWEEAIYGADPNNSDTDKDGTPDGAEVKAGRNPLVKGPNDALTPPPSDLQEPIVPDQNFTYDPNNLTQHFTKNIIDTGLLEGYAKNKDSVNLPDAINSYLQNAGSQLTLPTNAIDTKNLIVSKDNSPAAIKTYLQNLSDVFENNTSPNQNLDDVKIINNFLQNNINQLDQLDPLLITYQNILKDSYSIPVPDSLLWFHKNEMNLVNQTIFELPALRNFEKDPIKGAQMLNLRGQTVLGIIQNHTWLKQFLDYQKIIYTTIEPKPLFLR